MKGIWKNGHLDGEVTIKIKNSQKKDKTFTFINGLKV